MSINETRMLLQTKGPKAEEFVNENGKHTFGNCYTACEYYLQSMFYLLMDGFFNYLIFYISISCIGLFIDPIYLCFLLLDFVY